MGRLNVGQLIALLKERPKDESVQFDFGGIAPTKCANYRGYYQDLAIGFDEEGHATVGSLLAELTAAVGQTFMGWKGGEYVMRRNSSLWVANPGRTTDTVIVGINDCDYLTVLRTEWAP